MTDKKPKNFARRDLFDLPGLRQLRRWWFLRMIRGERGHMTRTLLFRDLSEAVRLKTPLDLALELIARGHGAVELPSPALLPFSQRLNLVDPARLVKLLAAYLLPWVRQGYGFSEAMARMNGAFSPQELQIVAMGERGGYLPRALERLADYHQTDLRLQRINQYLLYPLYIAGLATVIISVVLIFILPKFQDMFRQLGGELPRPTRLLVEASQVVLYQSPPLIVLLVLLYLAWSLAGSLVLRRTGLPLACHLPVLGGLHRTVREARWLAALTLQLENGGRADEALRQAGAVCGGTLQRRSFQAADLVEGGQAIGESCLRCRVLEHWVNHRLQLIDWRGNYIEAIRGIVEDADRRVSESLERFGQRAEIFGLLTVGAVTAMMVISLYLPLFNIPKLIMEHYK